MSNKLPPYKKLFSALTTLTISGVLGLGITGLSMTFATSNRSANSIKEVASTVKSDFPATTKRVSCPISSNYLNPPSTLAGTYFSLKSRHESILMFNNKGPEPLVVFPTVFNMNGARLDLEPLSIPGISYQEFNLRELLGNRVPEFSEGSVQVVHQGIRQQLGVQVKISKANEKLIFDEQFIEPSRRFVSSTLQNVWWLPSSEAQTKLIVSNTTDSTVRVTVTANGTVPRQTEPFSVGLRAHETRILSLLDDVVGSPNGRIEKEGGLSIEHSGSAGSVLARMLVFEERTGYSSSAVFIDPQTLTSSRLNGSGFRIGSFAGEQLNPVVIARNIGSEPSVVSGRLTYTTSAGDVAFIVVPSTSLGVGEVKSIDLASAIRHGNVPPSVEATGFEFVYSTPPGTVIMSALSVSQSGDHVFQTPLIQPGRGTSSGGYPWKADRDYSTILYIKNDTDEPQKYVASIQYESGSYTLGVKDLKPRELVAIDFRELRDSQLPDENGSVIPLNVQKGQIAWSSKGRINGTLSGRSHQESESEGVSSTYDCRNQCLDTYYESWIAYDYLLEYINDVSTFTAHQQDINSYGQLLPAYTVPVNWQVSNPVVLDAGFEGRTTAMNLGSSYVQTSWSARQLFGEVGGVECAYQDILVFEEEEVEIRPRVTISAAQRVNDGGNGSFNVTVQDGNPTNFTWSFEVPNDAGNNPNVTFNPAGTASVTTNAHWFARPDQPCSPSPDSNHSYFNSRYTIKAKVTFENSREITKETTLTVNSFWSPGGFVAPPEIRGGPTIDLDKQRNLWVVTGVGTMERRTSTAVINVPSTSQFYNKTVQHERKHEEQYETGMLSDLFTVNSLFSVLSTITGADPTELQNNVNQAKRNWDDQQLAILQQRLQAAEREAHMVSDPIAPQYVYQNCGRY